MVYGYKGVLSGAGSHPFKAGPQADCFLLHFPCYLVTSLWLMVHPFNCQVKHFMAVKLKLGEVLEGDKVWRLVVVLFVCVFRRFLE